MPKRSQVLRENQASLPAAF